jgi:hypothetical protein
MPLRLELQPVSAHLPQEINLGTTCLRASASPLDKAERKGDYGRNRSYGSRVH